MKWNDKNVCKLRSRRNKEKMYELRVDLFSDNMAVQLYMLTMFMQGRVVCKVNCKFVVTIY